MEKLTESFTLLALDTWGRLEGSPGPHQGWDGDGPPFPFFLFPLFWLVVIGVVVALVVAGRRRGERRAGALAGEQVLAERYAAGSIDEEEYRARIAVLREKR